MAPSQALFPFNRFTGGRKPKPPCRGSGDEMAPAPACCLPPPTISSPPRSIAPQRHPAPAPPAPTAGDRCCGRLAQIPWDESGAGWVLSPPPHCRRTAGWVQAKKQQQKPKKRKTTFFQPKPLIHPPASLPEVLAGGRAPASIAGRGDPVLTKHHSAAMTPVPAGELGQGMFWQQENPVGKEPGFGKNTLIPAKAKG